MDITQAMEILEDTEVMILKGDKIKVKVALYELFNAAKKQIPWKPVKRMYVDNNELKCPMCGETVGFKEYGVFYEYCIQCGQKMFWGG